MLNDQKDKLCNNLEVSNRTKQFQTQVMTDSGQPFVGPHTRTVQDGRKTSRSQEIDVKSFHEEIVSSDRSGQPVVETNTENVPDGCETRSCHESMRLNVEDEHFVWDRGNPFSIMTIQVMSKQCWTRWTWICEFQGYHILLWSMRRVQAFENWFRKLRTTQTDMLFNKIYDKTKPTIFSVRNQSRWFRTWAT